jgi:outer membrane protein OmpA-like peptidoglycan-associated protein
MKTNITNTSKIAGCLFFAALLTLESLFAQVDKRIEDANRSYAAGDYYTAAKLYEQYLKPGPNAKPEAANFPLNAKRSGGSSMGKGVTKNDLLFRQAESYRLSHNLAQASARYKEVAEKDASKFLSAWYWYAVCQRALGRFTEAQDALNRYLSNITANDPLKPEAEKELQILQFIKTQLLRPDTVMFSVQKVLHPSGKGVYAPVQFANNQFIVTSTETDTVIKEGVNPYHNRLYTAGFSNGNFENITLLAASENEAMINQGTATVHPQSGSVYFTQWKKENGRTVAGIYYSAKTGNGLSIPQSLTSVNAPNTNNRQPFCTADGKYLFFSSDRAGGAGGFDIWYAPLNDDGTTGEPVNAGSIINTAQNEQAPFYHTSSRTLVFSSDAGVGMGGYDLFMSRGNEITWSSPENMGHPVNSSRDDIYFYTNQDGNFYSNAMFSSDRGSDCCLETYTVAKKEKKKILTGIVRDGVDSLPLANAEVILKDRKGNTWKMITGDDGRYTFDLPAGDDDYSIIINKEYYKQSDSKVDIEQINDNDWLTEVLTNKEKFVEKRVVLKPETVVTVYFEFDRYKLQPAAIEKLDSVYNELLAIPGATLQISGYTDGRGTVEYNKILGDKRALACAQYLIQKGIDSSRITFESFGACCPVEMELINGLDNAEGRARNRRALINVVKPKEE